MYWGRRNHIDFENEILYRFPFLKKKPTKKQLFIASGVYNRLCAIFLPARNDFRDNLTSI